MKDNKKTLLEKAVALLMKKEMDFAPKKYVMKEIYDANNLVIGTLGYVVSDKTEFGPMMKKTKQIYIFEEIDIDGKVRYQEVFTGFIAKQKAEYFDLPYIENGEKLTDVLPEYIDAKIPSLGMLLTLNDVNDKKNKQKEPEEPLIKKRGRKR